LAVAIAAAATAAAAGSAMMVKAGAASAGAVAAAAAAAVGLGAVAAASAGAGALPMALILFGLFLGGLLRAPWTRFWATVRHPLVGWKALPTNWSRTVASTDFAHPPELVPGYVGHFLLNVKTLYKRIRLNQKWDDDKLLSIVGLVVYFAPSYLYRISIKSTFWVYWPLVYIADDAKNETRPAVLFEKLSATHLATTRLRLAFGTILASFVMSVYLHFADLWPAFREGIQTVVIDAIGWFVVVDFPTKKPWVWFSLCSAAITVVLFYWADYLGPELRHDGANPRTIASMHHRMLWMNTLLRIQFVLVILFTISIAIGYILWKSPLQCLLFNKELYYTLRILRWYYGAYMPQGPTCEQWI
jgi:hypothetical protein